MQGISQKLSLHRNSAFARSWYRRKLDDDRTAVNQLHPAAGLLARRGVVVALNGAELAIEALAESGVDTLFGIPGLYNMSLFDAARRHAGIDVVTVRHEQGATFMADGYGRATRRPAAVSLLPGCGVTNGLTGILQASSCSVPMVVLAGQITTSDIDAERGHLHELTHQTEILAGICKRTYRPRTPTEVADWIRRAVLDAQTGRPRPVQVELPIDVLALEASDAIKTSAGIGETVTEPAPALDQQTIDAVADELVKAEHPLIYAGGGVNTAKANAELQELAERLGAPVLVTGNAAGALATDHHLYAGVPWVAAGSIEPLVEACDAFIAVGTRFDPAMCNMWSLVLPATTVRIDIDASELRRNIEMKYLIHADARTALAAVTAGVSPSRRPQPGGALAVALDDYRRHQAAIVGDAKPWMDALRSSLRDHDIVVADMCLMWADMLHAFPVRQPGTVMFPWSLGTLGYAVPAAIGAGIARPENRVVAIVGDGAFLFSGAELAVAVERQLPIPFIVSNNNSYGMIKMQQLDTYGAASAVDLVNPDFVALGAAYGAAACCLDTPQALERELALAFERSGPTLIEIGWRSSFSVAR